jgi:transcriptional regulator with XRE-family HTH domain
MDLRKQFGRILRDLRTSRKLTQEELAERAGMDVTYLSDLERGRWNPSLAMIVDLANGLGIHPSDLLKDIKSSPDGKPPARKRAIRQ